MHAVLRSLAEQIGVRPTFALGLALAGGAVVGGAGHAAAAAASLAAAAYLVARRRAVSSERALVLLVLALAAWRAAVATPDPARIALPHETIDDAAEGRRVAAPALGVWRSDGEGRGWIEDGSSPLVRIDCDAAPREGESVRRLGGGELRPWARGPVPARSGPTTRFAASAPTRPDELVRGPPLDGVATRDSALERAFAALRRTLVARTEALFPPESAGLVSALLVGERDGLSSDTVDLFTRTGTRHLLALSGLHVGLVVALLMRPIARGAGAVLARAGVPRRRAAAGVELALGAACLGYAGLAGGSAPVVRAATCVALALAATRLRDDRGAPRRADSLSLWGLALSLECLADPRAPEQSAVALTYAATLGILVGWRRWSSALGVRRAPAERERGTAAWPTWPSGRALPPALVVPARRARVWVLTGLAVSIAAAQATAPLVWSRFGEIALAGIPASVVALPLVAWIIGAGWIAVCGPWDGLAASVAPAAATLEALLRFVDGLAGTPAPLPQRPALLLALAAWTPLALARVPRTRGAHGLRRASFALAGALLLPWTATARALEVVALDVGHGTAVLLRAPGRPCLVFDAGSRDRQYLATTAIEPLLAAWDVGRVDVVLSHGDRDHRSALARVATRHPPRTWSGALPDELAALLPADCERVDPASGAARWRGRGPLELVLARGLDEHGNEGSRALAVRCGEARVLLFGDAEDAGLRRLLETGVADGRWDVLLQPHHGSDMRWIGALFEAARPARVWVSAAEDPQVARELDRRGLAWLCTSRAGPLTFAEDLDDLRRGPERASESARGVR